MAGTLHSHDLILRSYIGNGSWIPRNFTQLGTRRQGLSQNICCCQRLVIMALRKWYNLLQKSLYITLLRWSFLFGFIQRYISNCILKAFTSVGFFPVNIKDVVFLMSQKCLVSFIWKIHFKKRALTTVKIKCLSLGDCYIPFSGARA